MTSELERNLLNADCHTVSLVHSLVLCSEFITHAFSVASRYVNFDQRIVRKMCLACEFGVVKGVAAFDDVISTLPTELQPHNLHPNYFSMMGVDRQANRLASYIPYILMSADLEEMLSLRARQKYRDAVNAA